jgi:membrane protein YqaA with SNARE-associated domain
MKAFVGHLKAFAISLGPAGLVLVTFLDSSILPLPEVPDAMLGVLVLEHPARWPLYAALATLGSLAGCLILYFIARAGGHAVLKRYLHDRHIERGMAAFQRYGLLTVVVPSILPPPMPFKPFVLFAGVMDVSPAMFVLAIIVGRGFRYGIESFLVYWYGPAALVFIQHNVARASLWFAGAILLVGLIIMWRRRRARRSGRPA